MSLELLADIVVAASLCNLAWVVWIHSSEPTWWDDL